MASKSSFDVSFRITNHNYTDKLADLASPEAMSLTNQIQDMFRNVYTCDNCPTKTSYNGAKVNKYSQGSVVVQSTTFFTSSTVAPETVKALMLAADQGDLKIDRNSITVTQVQSPSTNFVPDWGIALLVLVGVILFILLVTVVLLIIYLCRRKRHGDMEVFAPRGSYSQMNDRHDYPLYSTHSRFAAPNGKYSGKSEPQGNGNLYSFTNHAMETDNL